MGWKNLPYYIKWAIYGFLIMFILGFFAYGSSHTLEKVSWNKTENALIKGLFSAGLGFILGLFSSLLTVYIYNKKVASWIKGGIFAILIAILYIVSSGFLIPTVGGGLMGGWLLIPLFGIPVFLVGSFIGWLIGKFKK